VLTEEISQAEVLASNPFLVIDTGLLKLVIPTQSITHCVVLVSLNRSWKREKNRTRENEEQKTHRAASLFHSSWGLWTSGCKSFWGIKEYGNAVLTH